MTEPIEFFGATVDPKDHDCDWCERTAAHAFEIKKRSKGFTGQFMYGCPRHKRVAEVSADPRKADDVAA
jgi:hypothetical protein